ncbi:MAG: putative dual-specificity RNA methyltransferase RlmN [Bacteroidia bacterium]|nr:MAG: putative dual-specificity RNA methyltransferase RlmN [Bacteroidia bacterium]
MQKKNLKGLSLADLQEFVESRGEKKFRARQIFGWLYGEGAESFEEMTDISREFRQDLEQVATIENLEVVATSQSAADGTTKLLFRLPDRLEIESVIIPAEEIGGRQRTTLCVSTQVGCPLDCTFCATGTMGFFRNLTAGEIVDQVLQARKHHAQRITNLVFMGMGEPLLNYENVMKAVEIITDDHGLNIGARRITISTAGLANGIRRMADENRKIKLALSLHTLDNDQRSALMPINRKFGIVELQSALDYYYRKTRLRPTLEYILFKGFNDSDEDVRRLIRFSRAVPVKINLIPFHSIAFTMPKGLAASLTASPRKRIEEFAAQLRAAHLTVMIRSSAGEDIAAACGQLAVQESASRAPARSLRRATAVAVHDFPISP